MPVGVRASRIREGPKLYVELHTETVHVRVLAAGGRVGASVLSHSAEAARVA